MAEAVIPVDLRNPGQVFACLGLVEAAETILGEARGGFDWQGPARFTLVTAGEGDPVARVLAFLAAVEVVAEAPPDTALSTAKWKVPTEPRGDGCFPYPCPASPATLPTLLRCEAGTITLDHWGDATRRDAVKFWAGSGGYPGAALARDLRDQLSASLPDPADPFAHRMAQKSSFRFDWRRDYIPIDAGFSPNRHSAVVMMGYPAVELLAAIGLSNARPARERRLLYRYGVIGGAEPLAPLFLRAALGAARSPLPDLPFRRFAMHLGWPGQEDQARCITDVIEEAP